MASVSRRTFLGASVATGVGAALTASGLRITSPRQDAAAATKPAFHGVHQPGILQLASGVASVLAFDLIATTRGDLIDLLKTLTTRARLLSGGGPTIDLGPGAPTDDNGILGPTRPANQLTVTLGLGASLFDDRFGLSNQKPLRLSSMEPFPNDNLDPAQTGGDLSIQLRADTIDTAVHAARDLTKHTRGAMQMRWRIDGSVSPPRPSGTPRNYLGFKDGIANPDVTNARVAESLIWVQPETGEPAWATGGTYQVVRIIRMLVEFWDRVSLQEQETMIGRRRDTGAPLDGNHQNDIPHYAQDPSGTRIPLTAHIRLANPRQKATESSQILRRGFNYDRGIDVNGNLDQGLIFTCYQQDLKSQFQAVQTRLIDEPLVDYISPVGGGYFFVPAGVADEEDYYARGLISAGNP